MGEIKIQVQTSKVKNLEIGKLNLKNYVNVEENPTHYYSTLAKQWAILMDNKVQNEDYSSKHYASISKNNADISENNKNTCENIYISMNNNYQRYLEDIQQKQDEITNNLKNEENDAILNITQRETDILNSIEIEANKQILNIEQAGFYMRDDKLYYIDSNGKEKEFVPEVDWSEWATSLNGRANTDLSNLSEAGQAIIDSKADKDELGGVWVKKHKELLVNVSCTGTTGLNLDLSDYLPIDDNAYELQLSAFAHLDGIAFHGSECGIISSLGEVVVASVISAINQGLSVGASTVFPVGKDRIFIFKRKPNLYGTVSLNVDAYRKIRS